MTSAITWPEVVAQLERVAPSHGWARDMLSFVRQITESSYAHVFFPNVSTMQRKLFLAQRKEYEVGRNILEIYAGELFEFVYVDSGIRAECWRRTCQPTEAFSLLEKFIDQLHLVIRRTPAE